MRNRILPLLVALLCLYACDMAVAKSRNGVSFKNAVEYNDYIIGRQQKIAGFINQFISASNVSPDSALIVLDKSAQETDEFLKDIAAMSPYKGDSVFRNAAVQTFAFYKRILSEDYKRLIQINIKKEGASETEMETANAIVENLSTEESELDKRFQNAQTDFAHKNNIRLEKDKKIN